MLNKFLHAYEDLSPALFKIPAETAHNITIRAFKSGLFKAPEPISAPELESVLWGLKFPSPVGLAAGFDKNAEVIAPCLNLGFGFVEAGTVTPKPQHGNPKPRIFRDPLNKAVINRMGFPGLGMNAFKENMEGFLAGKTRHSKHPRGIVGINIGMNKDQSAPEQDYSILIQRLGAMADYLTVNISSPNTPGLRDLQRREPLLQLLGKLKEQRAESCGDHPPPLLVKFAPDLTEDQQQEMAETALEAGIDGIVLTNTTLERPNYLSAGFAEEKGGLSGQPVKALSLQILKNFHRLTEGKIPLIGVGGISTGQDAYERLRAGASLVQLYSSLVYRGPFVAYYINNELLELMRADGYSRVSEIIGIDA